MKNILFLGQKEIGERCFNYLLEQQSENFRVSAVVSNQSSEVWWKSNEIFQYTRQCGLAFVDNSKRNEKSILEMIENKKINLLISVQHSWILPNSIIKAVDGLAFNLHNAKLPEYKGNNCCNHAILNQEENYTCTIHWLTKEVDMGDIAYEKSFPIESDETANSLYKKAQLKGYVAFKCLIDDLKSGKTPQRRKITNEGTFYPRNSMDKYRVIHDITNYHEVDLKSRACYFPPHKGAYFVMNGKKFYVYPK